MCLGQQDVGHLGPTRGSAFAKATADNLRAKVGSEAGMNPDGIAFALAQRTRSLYGR